MTSDMLNNTAESYEMVSFDDVIAENRSQMIVNARHLVGHAEADTVVEIAAICAARDWDNFHPAADEDFDDAALAWLHRIVTAEAEAYMALHHPAAHAEAQAFQRSYDRKVRRMSRLPQIEGADGLPEIACSDATADSTCDDDSTLN